MKLLIVAVSLVWCAGAALVELPAGVVLPSQLNMDDLLPPGRRPLPENLRQLTVVSQDPRDRLRGIAAAAQAAKERREHQNTEPGFSQLPEERRERIRNLAAAIAKLPKEQRERLRSIAAAISQSSTQRINGEVPTTEVPRERNGSKATPFQSNRQRMRGAAATSQNGKVRIKGTIRVSELPKERVRGNATASQDTKQHNTKDVPAASQGTKQHTKNVATASPVVRKQVIRGPIPERMMTLPEFMKTISGNLDQDMIAPMLPLMKAAASSKTQPLSMVPSAPLTKNSDKSQTEQVANSKINSQPKPDQEPKPALETKPTSKPSPPPRPLHSYKDLPHKKIDQNSSLQYAATVSVGVDRRIQSNVSQTDQPQTLEAQPENVKTQPQDLEAHTKELEKEDKLREAYRANFGRGSRFQVKITPVDSPVPGQPKVSQESSTEPGISQVSSVEQPSSPVQPEPSKDQTITLEESSHSQDTAGQFAFHQLGGPNKQFQAKDSRGRQAFGHWGGPTTRFETHDSEGRKVGMFSYVNPNGEVETRMYVADSDSFQVLASDMVDPDIIAELEAIQARISLPSSPTDVKDTPQKEVYRAKVL